MARIKDKDRTPPSPEMLAKIRREFEYDRKTGIVRRVFGWRAVENPYGGIHSERHPYRQWRLRVGAEHRLVLAHQVAMYFILGSWWPPHLTPDHINRDVTDNRPENLRLATRRVQNLNQGLRRDNTTGFKGVHWCKQCHVWRASASVHGRTHHLGKFDTPEEASEAYERFIREIVS